MAAFTLPITPKTTPPAESSSPSNQSSTPKTLFSLPVEILVDILAYIPPRALITARHTCKTLKAIIDEPTNQTPLTARSIQASLSRLHHDTHTLIHYPATSNQSFITALRAFIQRRGIHYEPDQGRRFEELGAFADVWLKHVIPHHDSWSSRDLGMQRMRVVSAARTVMSAHMHFHMPHVRERHLDQRGLPPEGLGSFRRNFHGGTFPFEGEGLGVFTARLYEEIQNTPGGIFAGMPFVETRVGGLPEWYVSKPNLLFLTGKEQDERDRRKAQYFCSERHLARLLGVPVLDGGRSFSYCSRTEWAYVKLLRVVKGEERLECSPMEMAVVLGDLYIY